MSRLIVTLLLFAAVGAGASTVVYDAADGPGKGKHVVFVSGDEEYHGEEGLPMLAKILSQRHGFKCTVLFALDPDGTINPDNTKSLAGAEALDSADAIVMLIRFRQWPDEQMKHFVDAYRRGVPIVALRTSTHPFRFEGGAYKEFNDFGKRVIGEQWVSHWGKHKVEACRGVIEPAAKDEPVLRGVSDVFADSDVYEAYPPPDANILIRGQVLKGMKPDDPPAEYVKKRATDGVEQPVNDPMMAVAWTRVFKNEAGKENRILTTTMGAATDLQSEGLRRLIVNGVFWGLAMDVPAMADVTYVGEYKPSMYGFKTYVKGVKLSDHAIKPARAAATKTSRLELKQGDHIAIVGNALADRMQHDGHFETLIHARFKNDLTIRTLAVAGDEIVWRHRSENFGSPEQWLDKVKADVVFAFFGFNESFRGEAGLPGFRAELDQWLKETSAKRRVVLFSPIAIPGNANIAKYAAAMKEVAAANGVQFVDLFAAGELPTFNGIHLTEEGSRRLAPIMFKSLFGEEAPAGDFVKLRAAVLEKNGQWHARYRTVDGYNVYGGRSQLSFPSTRPGEKITNYHVMQEEMTQRDVLTTNRDYRIWAVARGWKLAVDDSDLPPLTPVPTNKPGPAESETHKFLSGDEAIAKMQVHAHCKVNLFADEKQFPDLVNPVQMAWDTRGRLWVSAWRNYPERTPTSKVGDKLIILEDTDGDGRADKCSTYLDDLNCPTGFQFYRDGVLVMQAPDLWFARDTDGDGDGELVERMVMGLDSADSHHTTNSMCYEPGGAVYLSDGVFHRTQVETASGPVRNNDAAIYRFEPRTHKFETYISYHFANPHGRVFDYWGNDLVTDATGNNTYFGPAFSGRIDYPYKHKGMNEFWPRPARPSPGTGMVTSGHFPDDWQGNFLNLNVISFQGIYRVNVIEDGSGLRGEKLPDLVSSSDPNFRPTAVNVGPDGAIYFADWHNPIIGHMQHHIRDPNRDHEHGRIYRITYEGRPLIKAAMIDGEPIPALLELLKSQENQTRELAKIELGKRDSAEVIAATKAWAASLDQGNPAYEHHLAEALWVHQWHDAVDTELLHRMLNSPEPRARAAATRVLCYWRDRVPEVMSLLRERAMDEHPRVRLEAVRAASFFRSTDAVEIALAALNRPTDYYIEYTLGETIRQLEPQWRESIRSGGSIAQANPAGLRYLLDKSSTTDLRQTPASVPVLQELLSRADVPEADRHKLLTELAAKEKVGRAVALLDAVEAGYADVIKLLPQMPVGELKPLRARMMALTKSDHSTVRRYAWAGVATADESFEQIWTAVARADVLAAVPLVYDPFIRARAYDQVFPLIASGNASAMRAAVSINREQPRTFAALAACIVESKKLPDAVAAMRVLPSTAYDGKLLGAVSQSLVSWAKAQADDRRTEPDFLSVVQFTESLAGIVPPALGASMLDELRPLRVPVFHVRAIREQMRYDTPRLVVEAGKAFEITFENTDFMPHNMTIVKPGARERIGKAAMVMKPDQLDGEGRAYVPGDPDILAATKMLDAGQRETLKLTAPETEGVHEYVCTYPDHWQVMWGKLVVTKDVDAYLRSNPEKPSTQPKHVHQHASQ